MSTHLDLEEQEQLESLKHFWRQHGNLISWVLIAVLSLIAAWNFYQHWQRQQAAQAAALYDEVERVIQAGDIVRLERVLSDMRDKFASTTYAQQAGLLAARVFSTAGKPDEAKAALQAVADKTGDEGYRALARLRLAGLLMDAQSWDAALQQLDQRFPAAFEALVADRRGDIFQAQGKKDDAIAQYRKAYQALDTINDYRYLVEIKLAALGVDVQAAALTAGVRK